MGGGKSEGQPGRQRPWGPSARGLHIAQALMHYRIANEIAEIEYTRTLGTDSTLGWKKFFNKSPRKRGRGCGMLHP